MARSKDGRAPVSRSARGSGARHRTPSLRTATPSIPRQGRLSRRPKSHGLYCLHEGSTTAQGNLGRRVAAAPDRPHATIASSGSGPRRPHRGGRREKALCSRGGVLDVRVLHQRSPSLGGRGLSAHRRGARLAAVPESAGPSGRGPPSPHRSRQVGAPPHPGERGRSVEAGYLPVQAADRRSGRRAQSSTGCSGGGEKASDRAARPASAARAVTTTGGHFALARARPRQSDRDCSKDVPGPSGARPS